MNRGANVSPTIMPALCRRSEMEDYVLTRTSQSAPTVNNPTLKAAVLADGKQKLARAWAAFKLTAEDTVADEIETLGKKRFGDAEFGKAMRVAEDRASNKAEEMSRMLLD
ncbi:hypothetical protein LTR36_004195 [Oleoguttula mirabilis]|uniref:Uncharacterized protein n=1 Tax=Oleoguttula mirabilis TaxID=1507867 RepID=A0AAV9JHF9_9PEZI|nr:hypothetical protein LTR36_004195 [Oleoguttula mirabilis]